MPFKSELFATWGITRFTQRRSLKAGRGQVAPTDAKILLCKNANWFRLVVQRPRDRSGEFLWYHVPVRHVSIASSWPGHPIHALFQFS